MVATIATHDLAKIKTPLLYTTHAPKQMQVHPLGRGKVVSAWDLYNSLQREAEIQRKQQKRNVAGLHRQVVVFQIFLKISLVYSNKNLELMKKSEKQIAATRYSLARWLYHSGKDMESQGPNKCISLPVYVLRDMLQFFHIVEQIPALGRVLGTVAMLEGCRGDSHLPSSHHKLRQHKGKQTFHHVNHLYYHFILLFCKS